MSDSEQTPPLTAPAHVAGIDREAFRRAVDDDFETVIDQLTELVETVTTLRRFSQRQAVQ